MTREEQRAVKEMGKLLNQSLRPSCKKHGYKHVAGFVYQVSNNFLYTVFLSVPPVDKGQMISVTINYKLIELDTVFWDVFDMAETARQQPFSFHVRGAFTPYSFLLDKWKEPIASADAMEKVLDAIFHQVNQKIEANSLKMKTMQDFKQAIEGVQHQKLNYILCEIAEGSYAAALQHIQAELLQNNTGGFSTSSKNIMEYARDYCTDRMKKIME